MSCINPHLESRGLSRGSRAPSQASTTDSQARSTTGRTETRGSPGSHRLPPTHRGRNPQPHEPQGSPPWEAPRPSHPLHAGNTATAPGEAALPGIPPRVDASPPQRSSAAAATGPRQLPPAPGRDPPTASAASQPGEVPVTGGAPKLEELPQDAGARPSGPRAAHPTNLRRPRPAGSGLASPRGTGGSHGQAPGARREETPAGQGCRVRGLREETCWGSKAEGGA